MRLNDRECPVCLKGSDFAVVREANYDLSKLDEFAFSSRKVPENMHFRLVCCRDCDLLFATPAPVTEDLIQQYEGAAFDSGEEADCASETYAKYLEKFLTRLPNLHGAIDIGSGNGSFLEHLLRLGFDEVIGAEPSLAPIQAAKPEIRPLLRHGAFKVSDFSPGQYSLISCFQTLEHVSSPGELAEDAFRLLRPGGAVFFVCHNYRSFLARVMGTSSPIFDIEHLQLFSPKSLNALLQRRGFEKVRVFPIMNRYPAKYWMRLLPLGRTLKARLVSTATRMKIAQMQVPFFVGNLGVFAQKPL